MNNFVCLDVETANYSSDSICQIGIAVFKDGILAQKFETLVNPQDYFDDLNIGIHGITAEMVKDAPTFDQIFNYLRTAFDGQIVVHHTAFDRVSINRASLKYGYTPVEFHWLDSARVARRAWQDCRHSGYGLASLAEKYNIDFIHHNAFEDARVAGEILLKAINETGISLEDWTIKAYQSVEVMQHIARSGDPNGPLYGEIIVFTGALQLPRSEAAEIAAKAGCDVGGDVTSKTTLLVVGTQDKRQLAGKDKSSKHIKAELLISKGIPIRIITESDFYNLVEIA